MSFNSLIFIGFFIIVYFLYLVFHKKCRLQNILLLISSYVFYGCWDWRFLSLIAISTFCDFFVANYLDATEDQSRFGQRKRKLLLFTSIFINLTILGFFKYFNFFADNFISLFSLFGLNPSPVMVNIILPVGISFYTFQTMSYTIDVYWKRMRPTKDLLNFAVFVAFFPQLVAGPIERAANFLPQVEKPRKINIEQIDVGIYLILWGYFKKVVVADNVGIIADTIFNNFYAYSGLDIIVGVLAFSVQIYCDFSGYSDIARGISKLMGFEIMVNFRLPYFALNPSDFWQRWHISLSSWLRDYLYVPLGGNRKGTINTYRNLTYTMLLGGLWHGASWNFVIWGAYHGLILSLYRIFEKNPSHQNPWENGFSFQIVFKLLLMLFITIFGWFFFRCHSIEQIVYMLKHISIFPSSVSFTFAFELMFFIFPLLAFEIYQYFKKDLLIITKIPIILRSSAYSFMLSFILIFGVRESLEFVYFQF